MSCYSVAYERGNFCTCRASCWSSACGQGRPAHTSMRCSARSGLSERRLVPGGRSKDKDECPMAVHVRDPLGHSRDESRERLEARSDTVTLPTKSTHVHVICFRTITPIDQTPFSPSSAYSNKTMLSSFAQLITILISHPSSVAIRTMLE